MTFNSVRGTLRKLAAFAKHPEVAFTLSAGAVLFSAWSYAVSAIPRPSMTVKLANVTYGHDEGRNWSHLSFDLIAINNGNRDTVLLVAGIQLVNEELVSFSDERPIPLQPALPTVFKPGDIKLWNIRAVLGHGPFEALREDRYRRRRILVLAFRSMDADGDEYTYAYPAISFKATSLRWAPTEMIFPSNIMKNGGENGISGVRFDGPWF
jgi:hypothetical protein